MCRVPSGANSRNKIVLKFGFLLGSLYFKASWTIYESGAVVEGWDCIVSNPKFEFLFKVKFSSCLIYGYAGASPKHTGLLVCTWDFSLYMWFLSVIFIAIWLPLTGKGNCNSECLDVITNLNIANSKLLCSRCVQHVAVCQNFIYFGS